MPELDEHIRRINEKVQLLLKQYAVLQKENEKLKSELIEIKTRAEENDSQLDQLRLRIDVLKAAKGQMNEEERKAYEKRINLYLREIEKCIALLNE